MAEEIHVSFPGNLRVDASINDFNIRTDQPEKSGGDNSAPSPFTLFTASLATCAGYFALKFCNARDINVKGMSLKLKYEWDKKEKRYPKMVMELTLPEGFPEKYRGAIIKAVDQCVVKKHIIEAPEFEIELV